MPHSFLANSFAYQSPEMSVSSYILPKNDNPSYNKCDIKVNNKSNKIKKNNNKSNQKNQNDVDETNSFIYCNFNKHLKFDPHLFKEWLKVLESVENSYLCLLENPKESKEYITTFIDEYNSDLLDRVGYLPFIGNPYDNQRRNAKYCNVILDTTIYNGHTTAADALWGGVPVITRGDIIDMGGRVGSSILTALGVPDLITYNQIEYTKLAVKLAKNEQFYTELRTKIVSATLAKAPANPFWDLQRYVRNLENGFEKVWNLFINNENPRHVYVEDQGANSVSKIKNSTKKSYLLKEKKRKVVREKKIRGQEENSHLLSSKRKRRKTDVHKVQEIRKSRKSRNSRKSKNEETSDISALNEEVKIGNNKGKNSKKKFGRSRRQKKSLNNRDKIMNNINTDLPDKNPTMVTGNGDDL